MTFAIPVIGLTGAERVVLFVDHLDELCMMCISSCERSIDRSPQVEVKDGFGAAGPFLRQPPPPGIA
jgi:hypothetical protein